MVLPESRQSSVCMCAVIMLTLCDPMACIDCQTPQEFWSGLPFPTPGDLLDPGIEPVSLVSPAMAGESFTMAPPGKTAVLWRCNVENISLSYKAQGLPWWLRWQRLHLQRGKPGFHPWLRKILWRREWQPTLVFLP